MNHDVNVTIRVIFIASLIAYFGWLLDSESIQAHDLQQCQTQLTSQADGALISGGFQLPRYTGRCLACQDGTITKKGACDNCEPLDLK